MLRISNFLSRTAIAGTLTVISALLVPVCAAPEKSSTINVANMDKSVAPCKDFFRYANGTWLKNTPIPDEYANWGVLNIINEQNLNRVHKILEDAAAKANLEPGSVEKKIGDFWYSGMDTKKIEADGAKPLKTAFKRINAIANLADLQSEIAHLNPLGSAELFRFSADQDYKDSSQYIGSAWQGGLGLPDRDYYTGTDEDSKKKRAEYVEHIEKLFELLGDSKAVAAEKAKKVMAIEMTLAEASMKNEDTRKPENIYHKMTVAEFDKLTPHFSWTRYLTEIGHPNIQYITVGQPEFFKVLDSQLEKVPLQDWKDYLTFHLIDDAAPYLSSQFENEDFHFHGQLLEGKKVIMPRWKRVVEATNSALGEAVGEVYVRTAFPPESKKKALELVNQLRDVLKNDLTSLEWMSPETRKNALVKIDAFAEKIGYPDKWRDYSKLHISRDGSYLGNVTRANEFEFNRQLSKIGKPIDRTEWFMNAHTVNAYYSPEMNEIVFPAGILQPPVFDVKADDATNLGGMGMVIGHEMTHGFDDQGSKFDAKGNLHNWWTDEDMKQFESRVDLIRNQYDGYVVAGDTHLKGKLVSGEAAADLGGMTIAYKTLEKILGDKPREKDANGFTPEQRFFLAFAQCWATNYRPERERLIAKTNPHPTAEYRVNGTLANMDAFEKAFPCDGKDSMMLPPEKRCRLW
ncbi:MAG: M13 family metallopeptidase [Cyanobacteria bacterium SZAS LIN-5]|nr:M13 family metallopeptidase [Cyanobacteria bacterium SZAS LIN-5]